MTENTRPRRLCWLLLVIAFAAGVGVREAADPSCNGPRAEP